MKVVLAINFAKHEIDDYVNVYMDLPDGMALPPVGCEISFEICCVVVAAQALELPREGGLSYRLECVPADTVHRTTVEELLRELRDPRSNRTHITSIIQD